MVFPLLQIAGFKELMNEPEKPVIVDALTQDFDEAVVMNSREYHDLWYTTASV